MSYRYTRYGLLTCGLLAAVCLAIGCIFIPVSSFTLDIEHSAPAASLAAPRTPQDVVDSYVEIRIEDGGKASGVVVSVGGKTMILTARHVAVLIDCEHPATLHKVSDSLGLTRIYTADVALISDESDIALLEPGDAEGLKPAEYRGDVELHRGEDVWYCGTPGGLHGMLERSIVANLRVMPQGDPYFAFNGRAWFGDSGAGIYVVRDGRYVLVGVQSRIGLDHGHTVAALAVGQCQINKLFKEYAK